MARCHSHPTATSRRIIFKFSDLRSKNHLYFNPFEQDHPSDGDTEDEIIPSNVKIIPPSSPIGSHSGSDSKSTQSSDVESAQDEPEVDLSYFDSKGEIQEASLKNCSVVLRHLDEKIIENWTNGAEKMDHTSNKSQNISSAESDKNSVSGKELVGYEELVENWPIESSNCERQESEKSIKSDQDSDQSDFYSPCSPSEDIVEDDEKIISGSNQELDRSTITNETIVDETEIYSNENSDTEYAYDSE